MRLDYKNSWFSHPKKKKKKEEEEEEEERLSKIMKVGKKNIWEMFGNTLLNA